MLTARTAPRAIVESGLFDQEWLEAQLGTTYASATEAAAAYLSSERGVSPHPLLEPDWIDPQRDLVSEHESALLWYLADPERRSTLSPHPLVDLDRLRGEIDGADEHPRGPLAAWLSTATTDTPLPVPDGLPEISWGDFRRRALLAAAEYAAESVVTRTPRISSSLPFRSAGEPAGTSVPDRADGDAPLVTVVLPTWNRAPTLRRAVGSVQAQSFAGWELLVLDDGSDDDTAQVLAGLTAYDERVVHVPLPRGGVCRARNEGIMRARGEYVAFLDSDNEWTPDYLATMVAALETHDWPAAHAAIQLVGPDGTVDYRAFEGGYQHLLVSNHIDLNVLVARTEVLREIGGFDEELRRAVDHDLAIRLAERDQQHPIPLVPVIGAVYSDTAAENDPDRISNREPLSWISVVLDRHLHDWEEIGRRPRVPGRMSIVIPMRGNLEAVVDWVRSARTDATAELVVVGVRAHRSLDTLLRVLSAIEEATTYLPLASDVNYPAAQNAGVALSSGERLVLVQSPSVDADVATLRRLADELDDPEVALAQPVIVDRAGLVLGAGAVFGPGDTVRPVPFLEGHAVRDAQEVAGATLPSALGPVVAVRAETLVRTRGVDPLVGEGAAEVDLSLRVRSLGLGRTILASHAVVTSRRASILPAHRYLAAVPILEARWGTAPGGSEETWRAAGFETVGVRHVLIDTAAGRPSRRLGPKDRPLAVPRSRVVPSRERLEIVEGLPRLRWTIDLASPPGPKGESWGDTHFARSLAAALERLGQRVAVDSRQLRHRASRDQDDVLLVLRGLDRVEPRPGVLSLEWIISHPDLVDAEEMRAFDAVFAASTTWSAEATERVGVPVVPLLQCTDPSLFRPGLAEAGTGPEVLFVGNSRGVYRSAVRTALAVGAPVTIHGSQWDRFVDRSLVASTYVPNSELGALYASAGVVLNDHWEDMRRDGFVSNRLFDAAAAGARILSDDIAGLGDLFGGLVQVYRDENDMRRLLDERDAVFPDDEERHRVAARIVAEHSFDARARTLADAAARLHLARTR